MENNEFAAIAVDDNSEFQPVGGLTMEDVAEDPEFSDESFEKYFEEYEEKAESQSDDAGTDEAPTTEQEQPAAGQEEETETPTTEQEETSTKIRVKVKRDHREQEVDIDRDELPGLWQRANNYDRLHEKYTKQNEMVQNMTILAKQLGFDDAEEMIKHAAERDREEKVQALVDEGTARDIAEDYVDRKAEKSRELTKKQDAAFEETDNATKTAPDYKAQVEELFRVRPDLKGKIKKLPEEVTRAVVEEEIPLRTAYAEWEARQAKAEQDRLKKENERFAQTAETATRAPVRGTRDTNTSAGNKPDPFERGFRENKW